MDDLISREAAIDAIDRFNVCGAVEEDWVTLRDALQALPSAESGWIPISDRLPKDGTECLVSVRYLKKFEVVDTATYSTDLFKVSEEDFFGNRGESGWYYFNGEYGYCKVLYVVAWMPLPKPYKGGQP